MKQVLFGLGASLVLIACRGGGAPPVKRAVAPIRAVSGGRPASADVVITVCKPSRPDYVGTVVITNHTDVPSDYTVFVAFDAADGKTPYFSGNAFAVAVQPGQAVTKPVLDGFAVSPFETIPPDGVCRLAAVSRSTARADEVAQ